MSIEFINQINPIELQNKTNKTIERYYHELNIYNIVLRVIKQFEGKEISKRLCTAIKKELPEYTIYYNDNYGMYHIDIWKDNNNDKISMLICHNTDKIITLNKFEEHNKCYSLHVERIEQLKEGLKHIETMCIAWNKALKELQAINKRAEDYYMNYDYDIMTR